MLHPLDPPDPLRHLLRVRRAWRTGRTVNRGNGLVKARDHSRGASIHELQCRSTDVDVAGRRLGCVMCHVFANLGVNDERTKHVLRHCVRSLMSWMHFEAHAVFMADAWRSRSSTATSTADVPELPKNIERPELLGI